MGIRKNKINNEDSVRAVSYINGTPYLISMANYKSRKNFIFEYHGRSDLFYIIEPKDLSRNLKKIKKDLDRIANGYRDYMYAIYEPLSWESHYPF